MLSIALAFLAWVERLAVVLCVVCHDWFGHDELSNRTIGVRFGPVAEALSPACVPETIWLLLWIAVHVSVRCLRGQ